MTVTSTEKKFWEQQKNKHLLLVGISPLTGLATSNWLSQKQIKYSVSDLYLSPEVEQTLIQKQKATDLPEQIFNGKQTLNQLSGITDIILSPGIARSIPFLQIAKQKNIPIWCDFDYFYPLYQDKIIIAVTGTDGKTTTVKLIHHLLAENTKCYLCGNVGIPFCSDYQKFLNSEIIILEISSYMLEDLKQFRASISLITNLDKDHLNRYSSFGEYIATKKNIYKFSQENDFFLQNLDDPVLNALNTLTEPLSKMNLKKLSQKNNSPSTQPKEQAKTSSIHYYFKNNVFFIEDQSITINSLPLMGRHNRYNLLFALGVCSILQRQWQMNLYPLIEKKLRTFSPLPHRLEKITFPPNITFPFTVYNDSKATTLQAVLSAIDSFPANVVLLMGGRGKGLNYKKILLKKKKIKKIFTYGEEGESIAEQLKELDPVYIKDLATCIIRAWEQLKTNDVFLFSPGCMSQDQFENFEQRGDFFKEKVLALT